MTQRWQLLRRPVISNSEKATSVQAMCVLHNYLCTTQDANYIPPGYGVGLGGELRNGLWRPNPTPPLHGVDTVNRSIPSAALEIRERLREYFSGDGSTDRIDLSLYYSINRALTVVRFPFSMNKCLLQFEEV